MPRVTDAYRETRRDEIAHAAMRCLARHGFARTSMADIIAESGLSAGSIYSHFSSKAEIVQHVARIMVIARGDELAAAVAERSEPLSPTEIIVFIVGALERQGVPKAVLLQIWAEATVDDELHGLILETVGRLRSAYQGAVRPWLEAQARASRGVKVTEAEVSAAASTMLTLSQGYITNAALFGASDPARFLASAGMLLR
jgi:AcrR family transcriptional regulator